VEIHQILATASPGDPVTDAALDLRAVLRRIGPSEIFAHAVDGALEGDVGRLADYAARPEAGAGRDVLVYHASTGEPAVCSFLLERRERLVLVAHPVPPAVHPVGVDPGADALPAHGLVERRALRQRVSLALAVSEPTAAELRSLGYGDVAIAPLPVDSGRLLALPSEPATVAHIDEHLLGPLVLSVGPVLPYTRPDLLLSAYHVLVTYLVPDAYLAVVGPCPDAGYRGVLESYRLQLNLHRAWFPGPAGAAGLAAWFRAAAVYVTACDHEDAHPAMLDAMAFDVPVVARAGGGAGRPAGAALLLPPDDDPTLLAEALAEVLADDGTRRRLVDGGRRCRAEAAPERARAAFLAHLAGVV